MFLRDYLYLTLILLISLTLKVYVFLFIKINLDPSQTLLWNSLFITDLLNIFFLWILGSILFSKRIGYILSLVYTLSFWSIYLTVFGSIQILMLNFLLLFLINIKNLNHKKMWFLLVISAVGFMWLYINQLFRTPTFLSDIGLKNSLNMYMGELQKSNLYFIGRIVENKFSFYSLKFLWNFLNHLSPVTYFTSQFKLFNFSIVPPILLGFLIPFLLGLKAWEIILKKYTWKVFFIVVLILPSVISSKSPNLSALFIFSPVLFFTIAYGIDQNFFSKKGVILNKFSILTFALLVLQLMVVLVDISSRESLRYQIFYK